MAKGQKMYLLEIIEFLANEEPNVIHSLATMDANIQTARKALLTGGELVVFFQFEGEAYAVVPMHTEVGRDLMLPYSVYREEGSMVVLQLGEKSYAELKSIAQQVS
jgi:hypothetical protein